MPRNTSCLACALIKTILLSAWTVAFGLVSQFEITDFSPIEAPIDKIALSSRHLYSDYLYAFSTTTLFITTQPLSFTCGPMIQSSPMHDFLMDVFSPIIVPFPIIDSESAWKFSPTTDGDTRSFLNLLIILNNYFHTSRFISLYLWIQFTRTHIFECVTIAWTWPGSFSEFWWRTM